MKQAIRKFSVVPSFRNGCIGLVAGMSAMVATSSFADVSSGAIAAIESAKTEGEAVGTAVVAVVAALCVVGVIIALVRKV